MENKQRQQENENMQDTEEVRHSKKKVSTAQIICRELMKFVLAIAITAGVTFLSITYIAQIVDVSGDSMTNTLHDGQTLWINKFDRHYDRFDIIVFRHGKSVDANGNVTEDENLIKRVIGLPGETVRIDEKGKIYISGVELNEDYGKETIEDPGRAVKEVKLADDEYFVLGDNRNDSLDSRYAEVGNIKKSDIIGKLFKKY